MNDEQVSLTHKITNINSECYPINIRLIIQLIPEPEMKFSRSMCTWLTKVRALGTSCLRAKIYAEHFPGLEKIELEVENVCINRKVVRVVICVSTKELLFRGSRTALCKNNFQRSSSTLHLALKNISLKWIDHSVRKRLCSKLDPLIDEFNYTF